MMAEPKDFISTSRLDALTDYDFGHTLAVVKAGEMLDFLDTPKNRVVLTVLDTPPAVQSGAAAAVGAAMVAAARPPSRQPAATPAMPRRGMSAFHQLHEIVKEVPRVVRPGRRFRVILHTENWMRTVPESFERFVIQVCVSDLDFVEVERIRIYLGPDSKRIVRSLRATQRDAYWRFDESGSCFG